MYFSIKAYANNVQIFILHWATKLNYILTSINTTSEKYVRATKFVIYDIYHLSVMCPNKYL